MEQRLVFPIAPALFAALLWLALASCNGGSGEPSTPTQEPGQLPTAPDTPMEVRSVKFRTSDGEKLHAYVGGVEELRSRPLIVEFSPYAPECCGDFFGPEYNYVQVHVRGTGLSTGTWGAVGPRDQRDVAEFLEWACHQPWSNGRIGLYGFSASAIAVYNSLHLPLDCVEAAALMAGTNDLYRDLLYPGGIPNALATLVVGLGVGAPQLTSTLTGGRDLAGLLGGLSSGLGLLGIAGETLLLHPTRDGYWRTRSQRPAHDHFPILIDTGFYDVESRGPFESYRQLRAEGVPVHLRVFGAHDGFPAGTPGPFPEYKQWFDRFLLGRANGIESEPRVQMLIGHGSYETYLQGAVTKLEARDWPVPGTRWQTLYLDPARSGSTVSSNDGSLSAAKSQAQTLNVYPGLVSLPTASDPNTTSTLASAGAMPLFEALPFLTQLGLMEPLALTWTSPVFTQDVDVVGPASLTLYLSSLLPEADIHAVIADVWPDGSAHAVGIGRLRTGFPNIVRERSRIDARGEIVQPYNDFSSKRPALPGELRQYHVEFWPIGNRFHAGHRLRLYLLGTPASQLPAVNLNTVFSGGDTPSRLFLPVLPDNDLCAAMAASC